MNLQSFVSPILRIRAVWRCTHFVTMAVAVAFNNVLRELRSYQEIQPNEAAKFGELLKEQYYWEHNPHQRWQLAQDLSAASTRDVRDVLKYLHKFVSELPRIKKYLSGHLACLTMLELTFLRHAAILLPHPAAGKLLFSGDVKSCDNRLHNFTTVCWVISAAKMLQVKSLSQFFDSHSERCESANAGRHKFLKDVQVWMEDPQRCCYPAVTAEAFPQLMRRAEPLPPMKCPSDFAAAPPPDTLPPPPLPVPPLPVPKQSHCASPTKALKAFCSALLTSWRYTGAVSYLYLLPGFVLHC